MPPRQGRRAPPDAAERASDGESAGAGRDVAGERLDTRPVEKGPRLDRVGESSWHQPAEEAARPGVDADDAVPALKASYLDLIRPHQPRTVDVNELPIEYIRLQQHLLRSSGERLQIERRLADHDRARLDRRDQLSRDEDRTAGDRRERARHRGIVIGAEANDQVVHLAEAKAVRIAELPTEDQREVKYLRWRGGRWNRHG